MRPTLGVCLLLASSLAASGQQPPASVSGSVILSNRGRIAGLEAELTRGPDHALVQRTTIAPDGSFAFGSLPAGLYRLRIMGPGGGVLEERSVRTSASAVRVEVRFEPPTPGRAAPGTVTLAQLRHRVPKGAEREFDLGAKAFADGNVPQSIEHLEKAIEIDPEYMEAHNNLGVRYVAMRRYEDALAEFRASTDLDPQASKAIANLAIGFYLLRRYEEAESAARRALSLDHGCAPAHYVLGKTLVAEGKSGEEAVREFDRAAPQIPGARTAAQLMRAALAFR